MLKKLDQYIIKTFFGPFLFIFSVLFFIFMVNIVWIQLSQFTGKGLSNWEIVKFLFYLSVNVVKMVLPLTILLASIMTFGNFAENYEFAAMKSSGISLSRAMKSLIVFIFFLSITAFFFANNIIPKAEYEFGIVRGPMNGTGISVKCEFRNGAWIIVETKTTWIS